MTTVSPYHTAFRDLHTESLFDGDAILRDASRFTYDASRSHRAALRNMSPAAIRRRAWNVTLLGDGTSILYIKGEQDD